MVLSEFDLQGYFQWTPAAVAGYLYLVRGFEISKKSNFILALDAFIRYDVLRKNF